MSLKCNDFARIYRINAAQVTQALGCFWSTLGLSVKLSILHYSLQGTEKKKNQATELQQHQMNVF